MISRSFQPEDIPKIDKIFRETQLAVPSLRNVIVNRTFEVQGKVRAYGVLKVFVELHLTLDPSLSSYLKAKIISEGVMIGIEEAFANNLERIHAIVDDEKEVEILKKHFGFKSVPGKLLVKEI